MEYLTRTLEEQKQEFKRQNFLAPPIAGLIVWLIVAISGLFFSDITTVWLLFISTGSIVVLFMGISKFKLKNTILFSLLLLLVLLMVRV